MTANKSPKAKLKPSMSFIGVVIVLSSLVYLAYKLYTFHQYDLLAQQWKEMNWSRAFWLLLVFLLLPGNWLMEALKWKKLTSKIQSLTLWESYKAVLAGVSSGFITPNRVGELIGRVFFLKPQNRKAGVTLSFVNSLTQNIVLAVAGLPACILFFTNQKAETNTETRYFLIGVAVALVSFSVLYFLLPDLCRRLAGGSLSKKILEFTHCLTSYDLKDLMEVILISFIRYVVFCTQLFFMLRFFSVRLDLWQALLTIPTSYLFVTFTPSLSFSEVAVRCSYAVLFIGTFSNHVVGIALASICLWIVNFAIPMLMGSYILLRNPFSEDDLSSPTE